ncbi:MAG: hypothetical protein Q7V57_08595 [Actinomycetota bacterium]|nr:hypothetical protein [Actinomycetota bacterium]
MSQPQQGNRSRTTNQRRRQPQHTKKAHAIDVWRDSGELPEVQRIPAPTDVGALLRSLGDPPVGNGSAAGHYFNAVVERAAAVALALAVSADLLADDD